MDEKRIQTFEAEGLPKVIVEGTQAQFEDESVRAALVEAIRCVERRGSVLVGTAGNLYFAKDATSVDQF